jgi:hypothetical protein
LPCMRSGSASGKCSSSRTTCCSRNHGTRWRGGSRRCGHGCREAGGLCFSATGPISPISPRPACCAPART